MSDAIGCVFTLVGALLLMCQVCMMDALIAYRRISDEMEEAFGHDTKIFPDN